jgi:hypothetical protein
MQETVTGRDKLVATDTRSGVGRLRNRSSICGKGNNTLLQRSRRLWSPPILLFSSYWRLFRWGKARRHETGYSPPCNAEDRNHWSCASALQYAFMGSTDPTLSKIRSSAKLQSIKHVYTSV